MIAKFLCFTLIRLQLVVKCKFSLLLLHNVLSVSLCRQQYDGLVVGNQCGIVLHGSSAVACNLTSHLRQLVINFV